MEQKLKQRICIEFCVKLQISATETFEMLNKAFPNDAPERTTVFEWHSRFKAGRISIEDDPRQGRPKFQRTDENVQKITDLIKENPRTTLLELEQDTGISKTTIGRIVTEDLKLKKTPAKFIPRFLTNEQKLCRLATCEDMMEMTRTDPEWKDKIITGDETWVYGYDPETKPQSAEWRGKRFEKKRPEKWTNGGWILHHDNARPHTAHLMTSFLAKNGTQILHQPPYFPDIAPNDFFLFPKLKAVLKGRHFDTRDDIIEKSPLALKSIPKDAYKNCFANCEKRWRCVIVKKLKAEGLDVGKATICWVVNGIGKKREAESNGQKFQVDRPRPVRTPATVSKVKRLATTENPPSQRQLSRMCGTSLKTINNIIHKDLELDTRRKGKVHKLTPFHMKNRATNARKLYEEHLAGSRSEYTATLDEAWMYVTYCNGIRKICYIKRGNQVPDNWVHQCSETFPKGFMVVGVMTGRGVLPLIKVPSKVKVNSEFYIECVLKPVIEQLKDLYPGEMDKVFLHHDKASSHTSNKTQQFLQEMKDTLGLNFIRNSDIPVRSPDASPLDFYGFCMLKQRLFNRRPKTEAGLWKAAQEEWSNVSLSKVKEVFAAWKVRCREIAKKKGKHIEHMKKIHENNLPVQALLILDNAPAHPPNLEDDILEELKFIKVLYLPPNTTPILQPMDQQVISNFKKLYTKHLFRCCFEVTESTNLTLREFWKDHFNIAICLQIIDQAWLGVTTRTLTSAWKKLWPVAERIYEELEPGVSVEEEIVSLGKSMGLEVEERDVNELIEEHTQELTTEEIQELQSQQHTEVMQVIGFEESEEEVISTSEIKEILGMWERVSQFVEKKNSQKKLQQVVHLTFLMTLA
ncbi:hypothetical protein LAZ67_10003933 [Cordylochernes scorpioides]|uniref:Transposase n=1 Tax=Cordylochernes scorpioides TaxID=51811 RepID=A0ABY6L154_9ARAC|nr:hypothetical protein LAZ67_10003933 [Cordylochernes scorpioides]